MPHYLFLGYEESSGCSRGNNTPRLDFSGDNGPLLGPLTAAGTCAPLDLNANRRVGANVCFSGETTPSQRLGVPVLQLDLPGGNPCSATDQPLYEPVTEILCTGEMETLTAPPF